MKKFLLHIVFVTAAMVAGFDAFAASPSAAASQLPSDSVYRLDVPLLDQDGHASKLADQRGRPVLIAMFYTSCKYVCPLIIDTLKQTVKGLNETERANIRVVLVSFDPQRDTPAALKAVSEERQIDLTRWTLARTDAPHVRKLAAVLGVQYRAIMGGDFNHSSVITLLDAEGKIVAQSTQVGRPDDSLVSATKAVANRAESTAGPAVQR